MNVSIAQICSTFLYGAAGLCVYLMLLNRYLILLHENKAKTAVILAAFVAIVGGSATAGFFVYRPPWIFAPAAVLGLIVAGEIRRAFIRRSCAGSRPLDSTPHAVYLFNPVTTTDLITHRYEVHHPKWKGTRLRVVHLTDLHVHPKLSVEYYRRVVESAEEAQADLAVFTGDFISNSGALPMLRDILRPIARIETFAVIGNHDYWSKPEDVANVVTYSGLRLLTNESATVTVDGRSVMVTGYNYPWGTKERTIAGSTDGVLHLVLSHTPDNIYRLAKSSADIVFSGHYHAGQIRIPFLGPVVIPSVYGRRFDHGHFVVNGTHLFVASGVGASSPPVRIYCQPDIFVVDILEGHESK